MTKPKRSHSKKVPKRSHSKKEAKRSHSKKPLHFAEQKTPRTSSDQNNPFRLTATTFWKQMEPAIHKAMRTALEAVYPDSSKGDELFSDVTRRIYRGAVLSAATFFQKQQTNPSSQFLLAQGTCAVQKAVTKASIVADEFDEDCKPNNNRR